MERRARCNTKAFGAVHWTVWGMVTELEEPNSRTLIRGYKVKVSCINSHAPTCKQVLSFRGL
jgi:hypothetical protein